MKLSERFREMAQEENRGRQLHFCETVEVARDWLSALEA
jgi:hypothetical protein